MRVLVVGGGGREHALVWKIAQSPKVETIYCAPGNPGIRKIARTVEIRSDDLGGLAAFAEKERIDLTVVGPELPLVLGVVDVFQGRGLRIFGPSSASARIEGSKIFAKELMRHSGIPTASWECASSPEEAASAIKKRGLPCVIKADGLAQGKGVFVVHREDEADRAVDLLLGKKIFGEAAGRVVIEEYLTGREVTVLAFVDGKRVCPMPPVVDYKAVFDGGTGPNTGGMGAYTPVSFMSPALYDRVIDEVIHPILHELARESGFYTGVLYVGLMVSHGTPYVLEFNARFGDPEAQVLLPLLETDLVEIMEAILDLRLDRVRVSWRKEAALCVVLASRGYPGSYEVGKRVSGLDEAEKKALLFHAGTARKGDEIVTQGGRVLDIVAIAPDLARARERAYAVCQQIHFDGVHFRRDIGIQDDVS